MSNNNGINNGKLECKYQSAFLSHVAGLENHGKTSLYYCCCLLVRPSCPVVALWASRDTDADKPQTNNNFLRLWLIGV